MSQVKLCICDQCGRERRGSMPSDWFRIIPGTVSVNYEAAATFCSWSCVSQYAAGQAQADAAIVAQFTN